MFGVVMLRSVSQQHEEDSSMSRNVYAEQGQSITWPVPMDCPHFEQAATSDLTWCETCGDVLWSAESK